MKWTKISAIIGTVFLVTALTLKLAGYEKDKTIYYDPDSDTFDIIYEPNKIEAEKISDLMFEYSNDGNTETLTLNIIDNEIVCSQPAEKAIEIIYKTMWKTWGDTPLVDIDDFPVRFPEPNEPKCEGHGYTAIYCPECHNFPEPKEPTMQESDIIPMETDRYMLDFMSLIPTWPDYIELEKDLVIDVPVEFGEIRTFGYQLIKGTKIYFKEGN